MIEEGSVTVNKNSGVGEVSFYHPKSNSLPGDLLKKLADELWLLSMDEDVKVIVLKSEGEKAFCAGASFDELTAINDLKKGKEFFMGFANLINIIRKSPKFIIVRVQGKTVGGGVGLIAAADYAFAVKSSEVKLSELALGIGPFVIGPPLEKKIGAASFKSMTICYEWKSADWALEKGLFDHVSNNVEEMDKAINLLTGKLVKSNPDAALHLKKIFWEGTENWDKLLEERAEISAKLVLSEFVKKTINELQKK